VARAFAAEETLRGQSANGECYRAAAEVESKEAAGLRYNIFKIELARRLTVNVLKEVTT